MSRRALLPAGLLAAALALGAAPARAATEGRPDVRRFALVVGANQGAPTEPPLRYAERDATRIAETLAGVGDFPPDQVILMKGVGAGELRDALIRLNARIRREEGDTLLFVFYSGHADADDLHLGGTNLPLHEIRALLEGSAAGSRVLVLDACRSGSLTRVKGGRAAVPFDVRVDLPPLPRGTAFITSSTATEDAQEWDWLRSSVFTHFFNSGLLGAADKDHDGRVTLGESFAFAAAETTSATVHTDVGPQNPTFRFELGGRQDLVLTTLAPTRRHLGLLQFPAGGRYLVRRADASGGSEPVAEISASRPGARVALPPGRYLIARRDPGHVREAPCTVVGGALVALDADDMRTLDYARVVRKGIEPRPVHSLSLSGGGRSNALEMGLAWQTALAFRQDRRRFSWEARLGWGGARELGSLGIEFRHQSLSASLAALRVWDLPVFSVALGLEAGAMLVRQTFAIGSIDWNYESEAQLRPRLAYAPYLAPVLQLTLPLLARGYVRIEAGAPVELMKLGDQQDLEAVQPVTGLRLLAGLGLHF
jgi:hypothetical protein